MKFNEALKKVTMDFRQKILGECLNGKHCGQGSISWPEDGVTVEGMAVHDHDGVWHTGIDFGDHHGHYHRYIETILGLDALSAHNFIRVDYAPIIIPCIVTVDQIGFVCGSYCAGNVRMAIFNSALEAPTSLIVETASVAVNGVNQKQQVAINLTQLQPGLHYIGFQSDSEDTDFGVAVLPTVIRNPANINNGPSWYREVQGYGAFPANATPLFQQMSHLWYHWLRVASVP